MKVVIHQPEYLPWLGFFDRIAKADLFIILDHVQFQGGGFINRNKIKTSTGWQWLTVPIVHKYHRKDICEVRIDNQTDWRKDHWMTLAHNYSKAPYFKKYADFFKNVFERDWELLAELDIYLIENLMNILGLKTPLKKSSSLNVSGKSTELLINICKRVGADTYFSGEGGKIYMDLERFKQENIKIIFQEFGHPLYTQQFDKIGFIYQMSVIDLLFNCGGESLNIIKGIK